MRILSYLTTFLTAVLLAACGGGGGSPGLSSGSVATLAVSAPSAVILQNGSTQQYAVQGGVKPYSVFSSEPAVVAGWLVGDNVFAVGAISAGKATVNLQDAKGTKFSIDVTAGSSTKFFTSMGDSLKITPGAFGTQTFILGGGVPPYKAASDVPSAVSVSVSGNVLTVTALQASGSNENPTTVVLTLTDSSADPGGALIRTTVTVIGTKLQIWPTEALNVLLGDVVRALITGGTPPYRAFNGIDEVLLNLKIVNGNQLEGVAGQIAVGSIVTIVDANNVTVPFRVGVQVGSDVLRVSPGTLTIPEDIATPNMSLSVFGVSTQGTLQVFSSNTNFLKPGTPVKNAAGTGWDIPLTGGNTCSAVVTPAVVGPPAIPATGGDRVITITVLDGKGSQGTSTITIKDNNGVAGC